MFNLSLAFSDKKQFHEVLPPPHPVRNNGAILDPHCICWIWRNHLFQSIKKCLMALRNSHTCTAWCPNVFGCINPSENTLSRWTLHSVGRPAPLMEQLPWCQPVLNGKNERKDLIFRWLTASPLQLIENDWNGSALKISSIKQQWYFEEPMFSWKCLQ